MAYKSVVSVFWVCFWVLLLQERLYWLNVQLIFPNYAISGCPTYMTAFWADACLGIMFVCELILLHQLFFVVMLYIDFFKVQAEYGFLKIDRGTFFLRYLLIIPLIDMLKTSVLTLVCLAVFNWGAQLNRWLFVAIVISVTTICVIADIAFSGQITSCVSGKLTPLAEKDQELETMID
jgi:hypothetical protein